MPVIYHERKFHFGIISQGEKEKLQEIIRLQDEKFRKRAKNELDECEEVVSRFLSEKADGADLRRLKNMIDGHGKCVTREIQWCRLILMTRTFQRDICLGKYQNIHLLTGCRVELVSLNGYKIDF